MEINLVDEDPEIEEINNNKALHYKVKYNGKNIMKIPVFNQWLNMMKGEKGDNGIICYYVESHLFFYFETLVEKHHFSQNYCNYDDLADFCEHCGELYFYNSICCFKKAICILKRFIYETFSLDNQDYYYMILFIIIILYLLHIYFIIKGKRKKGEDINYSSNKLFDEKRFAFIFFLSMTYLLAFFMLYLLLYPFLLLFLLIIRNQRIKDKSIGLYRY